MSFPFLNSSMCQFFNQRFGLLQVCCVELFGESKIYPSRDCEGVER
jgi:hypothetical protein